MGTILCVDAPFNYGVMGLRERKARLISAEELAYARLREGKESSLYEHGSQVEEGIFYVPTSTNPVVFVRHSLLLTNLNCLEVAVDCRMRQNDYFQPPYLPTNILKVFEKINSGTMETDEFFVWRDYRRAPTDSLGESELAKWLFKKHAEAYGLFLNEAGVKELMFWTEDFNHVRNRPSPFARQLWIGGGIQESELDGLDRHLVFNCRVRGVLDNPHH